jgi:two-component system nitrogen regulation response regulator GlnG
VVAATNQNLVEMVASGKFRQDLFYRLNSFTINLPPLRERAGDIPLLANHFLGDAHRKLDKRVSSIDPSAMAALEAYSWPGNVRELQNAIRYAVVHAVGEVLTLDCLPTTVRGGGAGRPPGTLDVLPLVAELVRAGSTDIYRQVTQAVDRAMLTAILEHAHGNQSQASELLGISRTTLRAKMQALGLSLEKQLRPTPAAGAVATPE